MRFKPRFWFSFSHDFCFFFFAGCLLLNVFIVFFARSARADSEDLGLNTIVRGQDWLASFQEKAVDWPRHCSFSCSYSTFSPLV